MKFKRKSQRQEPIVCDGCGGPGPEWFRLELRPTSQRLLGLCDQCNAERKRSDEHWLDLWFGHILHEVNEGRKLVHDKELMWVLEEAGCDEPERIREKAYALAEEAA